MEQTPGTLRDPNTLLEGRIMRWPRPLLSFHTSLPRACQWCSLLRLCQMTCRVKNRRRQPGKTDTVNKLIMVRSFHLITTRTSSFRSAGWAVKHRVELASCGRSCQHNNKPAYMNWNTSKDEKHLDMRQGSTWVSKPFYIQYSTQDQEQGRNCLLINTIVNEARGHEGDIYFSVLVKFIVV